MRKSIKGILILILIITMIIFSIWLPGHNSFRHETGQALVTAPYVPVLKVSNPQRMQFSTKIHWFGHAESKKTVSIIAPIYGRVASIHASDESYVRKGKLLFILGGYLVRNNLKNYDRQTVSIQKLIKLARQNVDAKKIALEENFATLDELNQAEQSLQNLVIQLSNIKTEKKNYQQSIRICSPVSGIFTRRRVHTGQDVIKNELLVRVVSSDIRIVARIYTARPDELSGIPVIIHHDTEKITASVTKILKEKTTDGGSIVWIEGKKLRGFIQPGESISGDVVIKLKNNALFIPKTSVIRDENDRSLVFLKDTGTFSPRSVETGEDSGTLVEIRSGLSKDDSVVTQGAYELYYKNFNRTFKVAD